MTKYKSPLIGIIIVVAAIIITGCASIDTPGKAKAVPADNPDAKQTSSRPTGSSPEAPIQSPPPIATPKAGGARWVFRAGGPIRSSAAIGVDGTVYIGSGFRGSGFNKIYALDQGTGAKRWEFRMEGKQFSRFSPTVGIHGLLYAGSTDKRVYALDVKTGSKRWEFETQGSVELTAVGGGGTVFVGSGDGKLYALDGMTGTKRWEFETKGAITGAAAVAPDGTVYFGSNDNKIYALHGTTGAKKWEYQTGGGVTSSPAIGDDGTLYIGSSDKKVYALDGKTGVKQWEYFSGFPIYSSPAIGLDGTVYVGAGQRNQGIVVALGGRTGSKIWEFRLNKDIHSSPAIGDDGTIYVAAFDKNVYALDGKTGSKKWAFRMGMLTDGSPAIGSDGTVYIGAGDGNVYAIKTGSKGLAKSPWPMLGQNPQRMGRVIGKTSFAVPATVSKVVSTPVDFFGLPPVGQLIKCETKTQITLGGKVIIENATYKARILAVDEAGVSKFELLDLQHEVSTPNKGDKRRLAKMVWERKGDQWKETITIDGKPKQSPAKFTVGWFLLDTIWNSRRFPEGKPEGRGCMGYKSSAA